ncbi:hypothetical protein [Psychrobacillus sp. L3]|uniref:hypothetical protein n=1 Tax=Psychrobacillus sp. L3 TaxID=3236891 RepID=UPI0036F2110F
MRDKNYYNERTVYDSQLEHCESFGISKDVIYLFIQLQEQKYEQNYKKIPNSWIPNKSDY